MVTLYGSVVSWFPARSYGFIKFDIPVTGLPEEMFVHGSDAPHEALAKDVRVSFEIGKFGGRYKAINVKSCVGYTVSDSEVRS